MNELEACCCCCCCCWFIRGKLQGFSLFDRSAGRLSYSLLITQSEPAPKQKITKQMSEPIRCSINFTPRSKILWDLIYQIPQAGWFRRSLSTKFHPMMWDSSILESHENQRRKYLDISFLLIVRVWGIPQELIEYP